VGLSSTEAEFYAASLAGCEVECLRRLLRDVGYPQVLPTVLDEDNQACIFMSTRIGQFRRSKHIDTRVFRLRDLCSAGVLLLRKIGTDFQLADPFTKSLNAESFVRHRSGFMRSVDMEDTKEPRERTSAEIGVQRPMGS
jgi:hypothetical protein